MNMGKSMNIKFGVLLLLWLLCKAAGFLDTTQMQVNFIEIDDVRIHVCHI